MKTITLPADTEHLYIDEVAHLIADCINPEGPNDPEGTRYKAALEALAPELEQAAISGALRTRNPETLGVLPPVVLSADPLDRLLDSSYSMPVRFRLVTVTDFAAYVADRDIAVVMEAPEHSAQPTVDTANDDPTQFPAVPNWKMRIQAEATELVLRLRKSGANPTRHSILEPMAKWCRDNDVRTDTGIHPTANYMRTHVLGGSHWDVP